MGNCFLHGNGGFNPLNYRVVTYATKSKLLNSQVSENTIGVVTDKKLTSYIFDKDEPEEPSEGMVWFVTSEKGRSSVRFNALPNNCVMINPVDCKQYNKVDGWVQKDAYTFADGAWIPWHYYLWNYGDRGVSTWKHEAIPKTDGGASSTFVVVGTFADGSIRYGQEDGKGGVFYCEVDLTKHDTIKLTGEAQRLTSAGDHDCSFYIWKEKPSGNYSGNYRQCYPLTGRFERIFDVSLSEGKYFLGFGLYDTNQITLKSISLEVEGP